MRWLLLIMTCLAAVGCNKTQPDEVRIPEKREPARPILPAEADSRPVIVVLGDSLAEGLGVAEGRSFPDGIQRKLDERGLKFRVVNMGLSGDTTTGGLSRLDYALSLKPAVLFVELGGNDGLRGIPVTSTKANLEKMIVAGKNAGADVVLAGMSLPPNYGADYIRKFEAAYKDLADKHRVQRIPFLMQDIAKQLEARPGLLQPDGIHPTAEGHAVIAETVFRYLQPVLAQHTGNAR